MKDTHHRPLGVLLADAMPVELVGLMVCEPDRRSFREVARAGLDQARAFPEGHGSHVPLCPRPEAPLHVVKYPPESVS